MLDGGVGVFFVHVSKERKGHTPVATSCFVFLMPPTASCFFMFRLRERRREHDVLPFFLPQKMIQTTIIKKNQSSSTSLSFLKYTIDAIHTSL